MPVSSARMFMTVVVGIIIITVTVFTGMTTVVVIICSPMVLHVTLHLDVCTVITIVILMMMMVDYSCSDDHG